MPQNIHGHKILELLVEAPSTRAALKRALEAEFGKDVEFHTCKSEGLSFDSLFDFFIQMNKVVATGDLYHLNTENACH